MLLLFQILNIVNAIFDCNNIITTALNSQCYKTGGIVQFEFSITTSATIEITFPTYWSGSPSLSPIITGQTNCKETTQSVTCTQNGQKFSCSTLSSGNKIIKCSNVQGPHTNKPIGNIIFATDTTTCNDLKVSNFLPYGGDVTFSSNSTTGLYPSTTYLQLIWDNIILPIQSTSNPRIEVNLLSNALFFSTIKGYGVRSSSIGALESIVVSSTTLVKAQIPLSIATKDVSFKLFMETIKVKGNSQPIQTSIDFKDSNDILIYEILFPSLNVNNDILTASLQIESTEINTYTKYTFTINIKNALDSAGFVRIALAQSKLSSTLQCYCDKAIAVPAINTDYIDIGGCLTTTGSHSIIIQSVLNPISVISIIQISYIETIQNSYSVDKLTNFEYKSPSFTPGLLNINYERSGATSDIVGDQSLFKLTITPKNKIPQSGTLKMEIPSEIQFITTNTKQCNSQYGCNIISLSNQIIIFQFSQEVQTTQFIIDQITIPLRNPYDTSLTGQFKFTTYDQFGNNIDVVNNIPGYQVNTPSSFDGIVIIESDQPLKNGQSNKLIFTINLKTPQFYPFTLSINVGDLIINNNPICILDGAQIKSCIKVSNNLLDVLISSDTDTVLMPKTLKLSVSTLKCKDTMTQSQDFTFSTKSSFSMSYQKGPTIINTEYAEITDNSLIVDPQYYGSLNAVYQFNFKLTNTLDDGYLINILFPFALPLNGYYCKDTSNNKLDCTVNNNIMIISGPFDKNDLNYNIIITGLQTPQNDQQPRTFTIKTYRIINNQQYLVDSTINGAFTFNVYCPNENNCRTCTITKTVVCLSCYNFLISQYIYMKNQICVENCEDGYYQNEQEYKCQQCPTNCKQCTPNNQILMCEICFLGFQYQDGQCLDQCGDSYYLPIVNNGICQKCHPACTQCSLNSSYCSKCQPNIPYYDHKCYQQGCNEGYYQTYNAQVLVCQLCPITCTKCISEQQCTECQQGQYFLAGTCRSDCPDGYFVNELECKACIPGCKSCQNDTECVECNNPFLLKQTKCVLACGASYYADQSKKSCLLCDPKCSTCEISNNELMCTSCTDKYYFLAFNCVDECPSNYYSVNKECFECSSRCLTCTRNSYTCTSCQISGETPTYLDGTSCVSECSNSQYADITTGKCLECQINCLTCTSSNVCTQCNNSSTMYYLFEGACKSECPLNYEPNGLTCKQKEVEVVVNLPPTRIVPVPHTLLCAFFIISSFVSKLHRNETYIPGFIVAFNSIIVWSSWLTLIILYGLNYLLYIVFACNYVFNIIHLILIKQKILSDQDYQRWYAASLQNKFTHYMLTFLSFVTCYPIYKLIMSKFFGFQFFKAKLTDIKGFYYFNCLSGTYIVFIHSSAIIATSLIAYESSLDSQVFISAIDALVVTFFNVLFLVWETQKNENFFDEHAQNYYLNESKQNFERQEISGFFQHPFEQKSVNEQNEQQSEQQADDTRAVNQLDMTKQKSQEQSCNLNGISIILSDKNSNFLNQSERSLQFPKNPLNGHPSHTIYYCQNILIENTDQEPPKASPGDESQQNSFKQEISQIEDSEEPHENSQLSIFEDHQVSPSKQSKVLNQKIDQEFEHQENNPAIMNKQLSSIPSKGLSKSQLPHQVIPQISHRSSQSTSRQNLQQQQQTQEKEKIQSQLPTQEKPLNDSYISIKQQSQQENEQQHSIAQKSDSIKQIKQEFEKNLSQSKLSRNPSEQSKQLSNDSKQFSEQSRQYSCAQVSKYSKKSENQFRRTNEVISQNDFNPSNQLYINQQDLFEPPKQDSSEQHFDHLQFQEEILDQQPNFETEQEHKVEVPIIIDDNFVDDREIFDQPVLFQQVKKQYKMKVEQKHKCKSVQQKEQQIKQIFDSNESIHTMSDWEENQISPSEFNSMNQRFEDDLEVRIPTHTKTQSKLGAKIKPLDYEFGDENNDQSYGGQALVDFTKNHQVLNKKQQLEKVYLQKFSKTQFKKKNESNHPKDISDAYIDHQIEVEDINF